MDRSEARRIPGIELCRHATECIGWQAGLQRAAGSIDEKDVVPFFDARRRPDELRKDASCDQRYRREPASGAQRYRAGEDHDRADDEKRIAKKIVDGQTERGNDQHQRAQRGASVSRRGRRFAVGR